MRENDEDAQMSVKSFEHCIEQVVRFHFPQDRSFPFTHWNARAVSIDPLWVRASVLDFIKSFQGNDARVASGLGFGANPCSEGANDGPPKKSVNIRTQVIHRKLGHALCQCGSRPCRPLLLRRNSSSNSPGSSRDA